MKKFIIGMICLYQKIPGPWHRLCRFQPTCSEYAIVAVDRFGVFKGGFLAIKRILRCNPFGGCGYDPVPEATPPCSKSFKK